jgi:quercetin dioxygenase-like cupin family protein
MPGDTRILEQTRHGGAGTMRSMSTTTASETARWWFGALAVLKATAADTGGRLTVVEITEPPNAEAPLHVHHREDEAFYVLEGSVTIHVGDRVVEAAAGDLAFGPRDVPHRYTVGPDGCRMLFICTPGGFERLVIDMSEPAGALTLPPTTGREPDWEHVAAVAQANGCDLM